MTPPKPTLFLDFDRTLFDLDTFMKYLGYRHEEHQVKFKDFLASDPTTDISGYMYPDTVPFLKKARETHIIVLLSRARSFPEYQRKKILGSRVAEYVDDIIVTPNDDKGIFAVPFLPTYKTGDTLPKGYLFVDDNIIALRSMTPIAPYVKTVYIDRRRKTSAPPEGISQVIYSFEGFKLQ